MDTKAVGERDLCPEASTIALLADLERRYSAHQLDAAWTNERDAWYAILEELRSGKGGIGFNYAFESVLGLGGAGAVFRVVDKNLYAVSSDDETTPSEERVHRGYRALKVPRPHIEKGELLADSLRDETRHLISLTHPNVVNLFAKGQVTVKVSSPQERTLAWPWYVMGYVKDAVDLHQLCRDGNAPELPLLVSYLLDVAVGLEYIHSVGIVHCDLKPANIFTAASRAIIADFGYAKRPLPDTVLTTVGFTDYFAHPDLSEGSTRSSQVSRTFRTIPRLQIRPAFDLFALGMTIWFLLEQYYQRYSIYQRFSYELKFLRLCAARLLDGRNHVKDITYADLPAFIYATSDTSNPGIAYLSAAEAVADLEKLSGRWDVYSLLPELNSTNRDTIQVSDIAPVVFTDRVRRLINHPFIQRLAGVSQLGLLSLVYPGAQHSRQEHSLGTFGMAARYLRSLHYDRFQPIFRQLVTLDKMSATLGAALFHDVGQYPLAHDLEDVSLEFFGHEAIGRALLASGGAQDELFAARAAAADAHTRSLDDLLVKDWSISLGDVRDILAAKSTDSRGERQTGSHVERLCKSLIDGPIDVDKLDYLQRDSRHCNVSYGFGIDVSRLIKSLTTVYDKIADGHVLLVLGVNEKGRISAESALFARYAMLTQVYWHHTMRAIKAHLQYPAAEYLTGIELAAEREADSRPTSEAQKKKFAEGEIRRLMQAARLNFMDVAIWGQQVGDPKWSDTAVRLAHPSIHSGDLRVLGWLWSNSDVSGRRAIEMLISRKFFKRVCVFNMDDLSTRVRTILERVFRPDAYRERVELRRRVQRSIQQALRSSSVNDELLDTQGFTMSEWSARAADEDQLKCLLDYPYIRAGANYGLGVVSEWGDRPSSQKPNEGPKRTFGQMINVENFRSGMKEMEKSMAQFRVLWDPDESYVVEETLDKKRLRSVIETEILSYTG
jgi:HD superfamily phosphohydrolase